MTSIDISLTDEQQRFLRFSIVGALGTVLDFSLLTALKLTGMATFAANSLSFTAGLLNNYTLNRLWTFRDQRNEAWATQLAQFALVSLVGLALNNAILLASESWFAGVLDSATWAYLPAKAMATLCVLFWNYLANRKWTFRPHEA
jgi:putative flippase GtrA